MLISTLLAVNPELLDKLPEMNLGFSLGPDPALGHKYRSGIIVVAPYTGEVYIDNIFPIDARTLFILNELARLNNWYMKIAEVKKWAQTVADPFGLYSKKEGANNKCMNKLEIIKALADLERIKATVPLEWAQVLLDIRWAIRDLEISSGLTLTHGATTPKKLWGKAYRDLTKDEIREYTQIKRIITRGIKID